MIRTFTYPGSLVPTMNLSSHTFVNLFTVVGISGSTNRTTHLYNLQSILINSIFTIVNTIYGTIKDGRSTVVGELYIIRRSIKEGGVQGKE